MPSLIKHKYSKVNCPTFFVLTDVGQFVKLEIQNIINEEAEAYFTGQKSLEEVAALIQNRVGLYLANKEWNRKLVFRCKKCNKITDYRCIFCNKENQSFQQGCLFYVY